SGKAVSVNYATADGSATQPADYTSTSGTLVIPAGQTNGTITVPVVGDTLDEPDQTFRVNLSGAVNATIADNQGVGTITNDDTSVSVGDATVTEGAASQASFTVSLSATSVNTVTVHYATIDETATQPADYTQTSGTLTFTPGQMTKTVNVPIVN